MIHFVGAGSGAPDLITIRGKKFLEEADVIIYAGSLVNPQLLDYAKEGCQIYNSAKMTLEEVLDVMREETHVCMEQFVSRWMYLMKKGFLMIIVQVSALFVGQHQHLI